MAMSDVPQDNSHAERGRFTEYLQSSDVHATLVSILFELYKERDKPNDPISYIQDKLKDQRPPMKKMEAALGSLNETRVEIERLRKKVNCLDDVLSWKEQADESDENRAMEKKPNLFYEDFIWAFKVKVHISVEP